MKQILAAVLSNTEILPGIHLLWAQAPEIASEAEPGQFVMVRTSEDHDPLLRRPMSIHRVAPVSAPTHLALLFAVVGRGTRWLAHRREEDVIDLLGPLGHGFEIRSRDLLLIAGGIGIAPLVGLSERALEWGAQVRLLLGALTAEQVYPSHLLRPEVELWVATEDGSIGRKGTVTALLSDLDGGADQIFACGPMSMYEAMAPMVSGLGEKSVQVSLEARMGCGFGACYGCAIETRSGLRLVCKDGPVFDLKEIVW